MQKYKTTRDKFKKSKKGKLKKFKFKSNYLKFGFIGLKALESGIINSKQIESFKHIILRKTKKKIKIWIRTFPYFYITKKPIGVRMGKGKGKILYMVNKITKGDIIFEIAGFKTNILINIIISFKFQLPIKTKILK